MWQELIVANDIEAFVARYDAFIIDCDGVLWAAGKELQDAVKTVRFLQKLDKKLIFVTNNSTKSRQECLQKFQDLGLDDIVSYQQIIPSTYACAEYLKTTRHPAKVFAIGSTGLRQELQDAGFQVLHEAPLITSEKDFSHLQVDPEIQAVVVGCDFALSYSKIAYASLCLQKNESCAFVATSRDSFDQLTDRKIPGMTASISGIESCTGVFPSVMGKPSSWLMDHVIEQHELNRTRTCMIGDRLDSDMQFGRNGNIATLLVLTGCTTRDNIDPALVDFVASHFGRLSSETAGEI